MAWIINNIGFDDFEDGTDCDSNPELTLMLKQEQGNDDGMADQTISLWLAGQAVTKPKHSDYI